MSSERLATSLLSRLEVANIRCIERVNVDLAPSINVLIGANGQGKTSLLEAIYLVATTRSFRTHRMRDVIRHGATACSVRAILSNDFVEREQIVGFSLTSRKVQIDGRRPESSALYALRTPVVVFHPGELELTMGAAVRRRTFLDRVALFIDAQSHYAHQAYEQAMKNRQKLLQSDGPSAKGIDVYEQLMAQHGVFVARCRKQAVDEITIAAQEAFAQVSPASSQLIMRYIPGGCFNENETIIRLRQRRNLDAHRQSASFGPHRDDLDIELNGVSARTCASQGQHRLLTLSLKIAEMVCVGRGSGVRPLLLLDDVSSELDAERTEDFFRLLGQRRDQVFITTTRRDMLDVFEKSIGQAKVFAVESGSVTN